MDWQWRKNQGNPQVFVFPNQRLQLGMQFLAEWAVRIGKDIDGFLALRIAENNGVLHWYSADLDGFGCHLFDTTGCQVGLTADVNYVSGYNVFLTEIHIDDSLVFGRLHGEFVKSFDRRQFYVDNFRLRVNGFEYLDEFFFLDCVAADAFAGATCCAKRKGSPGNKGRRGDY